MQRSRRKPVVARRSLPKEQKLDGFFVLKVPAMGPTNPLLTSFIPVHNNAFGIKQSGDGLEDMVREDMEGDSAEGEVEEDEATIGFGDGIGSDEPEFGDDTGLDTHIAAINKHVGGVQGRHKHTREDLRGKRQKSEDDDSEDDESSVIRCPCGNNVDYGLMIQCETCDVWQHSICVGIRHQTDVPTHYYCEQCHPRTFSCPCNKGEATGKLVQCTVCRTWQHVLCVGTIRDPYACPRCTSSASRKTSALEDSLGNARPRSGGPAKRGGIAPNKVNTVPSKRGRRSSPRSSENDNTIASTPNTPTLTEAAATTITTPTSLPTTSGQHEPSTHPDSINTPDSPSLYSFVSDVSLRQSFETDHIEVQQWEPSNESADYSLHHRQVLIKYSVQFTRSYAGNSHTQDDLIQGLSLLLKESTQSVLTSMAKLAHELQELAKHNHANNKQGRWTEITENVYNSRMPPLSVTPWTRSEEIGVDVGNNNIIVKRSAPPGALVTEYLGVIEDVVTAQKECFLADSVLTLAPNPFVLFLPSINTAVDARKYGSVARFVRRSCTPNSAVRFGEIKQQLHVGLFATQKIDPNTEITIPFDYPYQTLSNPVECACGNAASCSVALWFSQCADIGVDLHHILASYHSEIFSSVAHPYESDEDDEDDHTTEGSKKSLRDHKRRRSSGVKMLESTLNPYTPPSDKLTREQRKLQALMLSFEKMEKGKKLKKEDVVQERKWKRKRRDELTPSDSPQNFNSGYPPATTNQPNTRESREWRGKKPWLHELSHYNSISDNSER